MTRGDGTEQQTFEVVEDKRHKLLAFRAHVLVNGVSQPRVIVTNRDEPTVYSFSQILIYALLGAERPFHLSRKSTFIPTNKRCNQAGVTKVAMK